MNQPLPLWRSHKKVRAVKIGTVQRHHDGSAEIFPAEPGYRGFEVPKEYVDKHNPQAGGYYVTYEDGYASWSPADAFENGYTRI